MKGNSEIGGRAIITADNLELISNEMVAVERKMIGTLIESLNSNIFDEIKESFF